MALLEAPQLVKSFEGANGTVHAVAEVSLSIAAGDFLALHGPSGCGKSTLLLMLGGLLSPDTGAVTLKDSDVYALTSEQRAAFRAKHIGYVFQQFHLIPYLSVLDNVLLSTLAQSVPDAEARAEELLALFKLVDRKGHVPSTLSVGEQQRVALARALLHQPAIVFADEPTGNLDPENAGIILNALSEFADAGGAVVMVTHDPVAQAAAKQSLTLAEGKLV